MAAYEWLDELRTRVWDQHGAQIPEQYRIERSGHDDAQPDLFEPDSEIPF